jgi:hypothetical protein
LFQKCCQNFCQIFCKSHTVASQYKYKLRNMYLGACIHSYGFYECCCLELRDFCP